MEIKKVFAALVVLLLITGCATSGDTTSPNEEMSLRDQVTAAKMEAFEDGKYNCCLKHPCDQCIINMGACPCGENLAQGKPVCHECKGGLEAGDGKMEGIDPEEVEVMPRGQM